MRVSLGTIVGLLSRDLSLFTCGVTLWACLRSLPWSPDRQKPHAPSIERIQSLTFLFCNVKTKTWTLKICFLRFSIASLLALQIVGEIKAARDAVVEVTSRLRSYLYRDFFQRDIVPQVSLPGVEASSSNNLVPVTETLTTYQNMQTVAAALPLKVFFDAMKIAILSSIYCPSSLFICYLND